MTCRHRLNGDYYCVDWLFEKLWYNRINFGKWSDSLKKTYRVKRRQDFDQLFSRGKSIANRKFVVYHLPIENPHVRIGLSVSKKLGNAVTRNRIKRRLRHILHEFLPALSSEDVVVIARKGVEELNYQEMKSNLLHVLKLATIYQEGGSLEKEI